MNHPDTYLSVTTQIGCPVQCLKHCPQELITATYQGTRTMSLEMFKHFMATVPTTTPLYIGGFSEPMQNQEAISIIEWAHIRGHKIRLFTTMVGVKEKDIDRLCSIPFDMLILHLPDANGIAHIPLTDEYLHNIGQVMSRVKNLRFMNMGLDFLTNHREDVARGVWHGPKFHNKRTCAFMEAPRYEIMPNGEMYFCCECSCLSMRIGSIYENTYPQLAAKHKELSEMYRNDPDSICQSCCQSVAYWPRRLSLAMSETKERLTGGKMLKEIPPLSWVWSRVF